MKTSTSGKEPSHDEIALRAFLIWEKDGRQPGREMTYWLQAESEIRPSYQKQTGPAAKPWPPQPAPVRGKEVKRAVVVKPAPKVASRGTSAASGKTAVRPARRTA